MQGGQNKSGSVFTEAGADSEFKQPQVWVSSEISGTAVKCSMVGPTSKRRSKKLKFRNILEMEGCFFRRKFRTARKTKKKGKSLSVIKGISKSLNLPPNESSNSPILSFNSEPKRQKSGSFRAVYGDQSENSDICRNNERQWEFLDGDDGSKLWAAIVTLGVVDSEGRNINISRIEELEKVDGKEK
ncbi:unnamed protein product [Vicia faba]|uniref:Uncharacterized protein n=1 Tax=Vicia faba TaxID=3906 RepID=A0AAV0ZZ94_VICFA|nr:unnamed protein product [Vicia faba]